MQISPRWRMILFVPLLVGLTGCPKIDIALSLLPLGPPPKGSIAVDVGGYKVMTRTMGESGPTVVLINGLSENLSGWNKLQPLIAEYAKVIAYDRGGVGWSDIGRNPRCATTLVEELRTFLAALGAKPPYIFVSHSMGGLYARLYANTYPDEVKGMVLIDTTHEDMWDRYALVLSPSEVRKVEKSMETALNYSDQDGTYGEYYNRSNTCAQVKASAWIPPMPLVIVSQDKASFADESDDNTNRVGELFQELYREQASLVPKGRWQTVADVTHFIHIEKPEVVNQAVKDVIAGW